MFVKSLNGQKRILTEASVIGRSAFNAEHPFSVWLLNNSEFLHENNKSVFSKIKKSLCKLEASEMIREVNMMLKEIERYADLRIPEEVWLKEEHFIYF